MITRLSVLFLMLSTPWHMLLANEETLPPLQNGKAPASFAEMWAGFDPRSEPLEVETLKQWEEANVVLRVVRFRIGTFKGQTAKLAAVYGFPKGGTDLPGLLQIHGGGQFADARACLANARRGYATVSIAWAGRISASQYAVNSDGVKLFWDGATADPDYRLTTDWGLVDGYHAPSRNQGNQFPSAKAAAYTLDSIESPRNSGWFLCALAARRALTFLEQQPEVDADRLGVYGHSMGGKLTVLTAPDSRVKAAAPSCGGISDRYNDSPLFRATLGDDISLKQITCPIMFLSPANDFHGRIGDLPKAVAEIQSEQWRVSCSPHHGHQDTPPYEVATLLWFDEHLQHKFATPATPETTLNLSGNRGVPTATVVVDDSMPIESVEVFYTQHGKQNETPTDRELTKHRFWRHAKTTATESGWTAKLPVVSTDKPLWMFANVKYKLDSPVTGAGYYYGSYTANTFNLSSILATATAEQLQAAGVQATVKPAELIESFAGNWQQEWFSYQSDQWPRSTYKLVDEQYQAPPHAKLAVDVQAAQPNDLVVRLDDFAAEVSLEGGNSWQQIVLSPSDFRNHGAEPLTAWSEAKKLTLSATERLRPGRGQKGSAKIVGKPWQGEPPRFRNLRWVIAAAEPKQSEQSNLLNLFPPSIVDLTTDRAAGQGASSTRFSSQYTPSGSVWDERLDERQVFQGEMIHEQGADHSFQLRVGKGGQIYSLRGAFGESVPPSWRSPGGKVSPWNDEVWQFVAVCTKYNGMEGRAYQSVPKHMLEHIEKSPYENSFFIHNSGVYVPGESALKSLYCPLLAYEVDQPSRCFRMLNWGLVPQIKTVHRSPLLYYTQVRDAGQGVIELTWVIHNFSDRSDIVFDHLNAPWGGTRISSLPHRYVSSPDGKLLEREGFLSEHGTVNVRETGGWNISCASNEPHSPSLALVYGRDKHLEAEQAKKEAGQPYCQFKHSLYRDWRASEPLYKTIWRDWDTRPENSFRNYDVCEIIPKLRIEPDHTIWFRSFLVVGPRNQAMKQAENLVDKVDYGLLTFDAATDPMNSVSLRQNDTRSAEFQVYSRPVAGTRPLLLIRNTVSGQEIVTTDPYYFVKQEKLDWQLPADHEHHDYYAEAIGYSLGENQSEWKSLVGYASVNKPQTGHWRKLSQLLDSSRFPAATDYHLDLWVQVGSENSN